MRTILIASCLVLGFNALMPRSAVAQPLPNPVVNNWIFGSPPGSGTGNWSVPSNWSSGVVPNVATEDAAIINGGGTSQINTVIGPPVGSVVLGQGTAPGQRGTLEIQSGGNLVVVNDPTFPADGSVRVGQNAGQGLATVAGTGTLRVLPGGSLTAESLTLGGTPDSSIVFGGLNPGTASVVVTGPVTLRRTTRVIGPNVNFTSTGAVELTSTSVFIPEITGTNHSPLRTSGNAILGGTLQADFTGVAPVLGQSWNLIDAASVTGTFASILPDPEVPLGAGQSIAVQIVSGGIHGQLVQMTIVPEPMCSGLIAGAALAWSLARRRTARKGDKSATSPPQ